MINKIQEEHPIFEATEETTVLEIENFVFSESLPSDMSLVVRDLVLHFHTREERMQFGLGLQIAREILCPKEEPEERPTTQNKAWDIYIFQNSGGVREAVRIRKVYTKEERDSTIECFSQKHGEKAWAIKVPL